MMKITLNYLLVIILLSVGLQASAFNHNLTPVSLQLKWTHQFQFAGYYAALEQGFYEDEGLEVELREYSPVNTESVVDSVVSGESEFGIGGSILLSEFANGQPVVVLTSVIQQNPVVLLTKQSSNIKEPSDLVGKIVMFNDGGADHLPLQAMLATQGITSDDYTAIEHDDQSYQNLIDGSVDAISGYLSNEPYWFKSKNVPINVIKPQTYGVDFYGDILFTSQQVLRQDPEVVDKFKRASLKGWEYAVTHIDEMVLLIRSKYNPSLSHEQLLFEAQKTIELMGYPVIKIGHMHEQRWTHISNIFQQQGLIKQEVDFNRFIYKPTSRTYFYIAVGLAMIVLCLLIWSIRNYISHHKLTAHINRLNRAFGATKQGWFDLNLITDEIIISDESALILGYESENFNTNFHKWLSNVHLDDKDKVIAIYKQFLTTSDVKETEFRRKTKDGTWLWLHTVGQCVEWNKSGSATRVIGVHTDISKQKQAEHALKKNQTLLLGHQGALLELAKKRNNNIETALSRILTVTAEQLHVSRASVWLLNKDNTAITCKALYDNGNLSYEEMVLESKDYPSYFSAIEGSGFISASDAHKDPNTIEFSDHYLTPLGITSMLDSPIRIQGKTIGITCCEYIGPKRKWTLEEEDFSRSVSELCAQAFLEIEQKRSEEKLQLSARVFSNTHEGIKITDDKMNIIDINPAFCDITGYSRDEVIGKNPRILSSGKQSPEFYQNMWQQVNEQGHWQGEVWNRKKEGQLYAELLTISVLKDEFENIVNYVGIFTDITSSKKQQEKLSLMAHYDVLTGLPNRALFTDRFTQAIAHSKRTKHQLAICFLDLDNFKPVNDTYGHEMGDKILIEVAERITANIREEDTVSRQGGDEFALLLNDIESFAQCEQTLQRIHHALGQPFFIDDAPYKITASSGVTLYPNDDADIDTLLRHADQAMYQAKLEGKHRYHLFDPEHDQRTIEKHHQLDEIEQALANNEFQLYYQPKVNMVTGVVFGAEALIRWIHPEKGLIPPLDFLPLIDNTELELRVGNWVINQALSQLGAWDQQGIQIEVSINIASHHLLSETFFSELESALTKHPSVGSEFLQLEILESSALGDLNAITTVIETCQGALGVKVALDDFGTGYSSLTHLRTLPADTIKIDQSFVRDMLDDPSDYDIIDGIIGLSDSFNRKVIAEGVETTKHGLMLLMMGCEEAQGYGISRPLPADDFPQWLEDYTPNQEWQLCGNEHRSNKENKIKLFRLITDHWKDAFINNIQRSSDNVEHWPIMSSKHCPCGTWIKRAKQEQLFGGEGLNQLYKTHEALHLVAQALHLQYQEGDIEGVIEGLPELQAAFDGMVNALGKCE